MFPRPTNSAVYVLLSHKEHSIVQSPLITSMGFLGFFFKEGKKKKDENLSDLSFAWFWQGSMLLTKAYVLS